MKKILFVLTMIAILVMVVGCCTYHGQSKEPLIAKIRYFDGSLDTLFITSWGTNGSTIWFTSIDGVETTTGSNNVIIIKGDKLDE